jgi:hypothetical protein
MPLVTPSAISASLFRENAKTLQGLIGNLEILTPGKFVMHLTKKELAERTMEAWLNGFLNGADVVCETLEDELNRREIVEKRAILDAVEKRIMEEVEPDCDGCEYNEE